MRVGVRALLLLSLAGAVLPSSEIRGRLKKVYDQYDPLAVARCEVRCGAGNGACLRNCLLTPYTKPGACPTNATLSRFESVCKETCHFDSRCPEVTKCCRHSCGVTCQTPQGLEETTNIPEIPNFINVSEFRPRRRTFLVRWSKSPGTVLYLLEERYTSGKRPSKSTPPPWVARVRTTSTPKAVLTAKPGRRYQYRVAALGVAGDSRGFSKETEPFAVAAGPKRPNSTNITIDTVRANADGTVRAEFHWEEPASDLPVKRYKVFWSERLQGATALDSVLVNRQVVPRRQTSFLLPNLKPNCSYFLQVQAISQFGKETLRGEKANYYLNTTDYTNVTERAATASWKSESSRPRVRRLFWGEGGLGARLEWAPGHPGGASRVPHFFVVWRAAPCGGRKGGKTRATTTETHFDLFDLQFNCRYHVNIKEISNGGVRSKPDTSVTFTTPSCKKFQETSKKKVRCND